MSDNADENGSETFEYNIEMAAHNSIKFLEELISKLSVHKK
jgi:nucleoside phosphorylase